MTTKSILALTLWFEWALAGASLPSPLLQLRFNSAGTNVLAQDENSITVLALDPLRVLFRVSADKHVLGQFTPDSQELVFVRSMTGVDPNQINLNRSAPQVERWSVRSRSKINAHSIPDLVCGTSSLAPDGLTLACNDLKGALHVVDVVEGREVFIKKKFVQDRVWLTNDNSGGSDPADLWAADFEYSPDGRFLIAVSKDGGVAAIWDCREKRTVKALGAVKRLSTQVDQTEFFTFQRGDALSLVRRRWAQNEWNCDAITAHFPSGVVISTQRLPRCPGGLGLNVKRLAQRPFRRATDDRFVVIQYEEIIRRGAVGEININKPIWLPLGGVGREAQIRTAGVELSTGRLIFATTQALDIFGTRHIEEIRPGEIGLWEVGAGLVANVSLNR